MKGWEDGERFRVIIDGHIHAKNCQRYQNIPYNCLLAKLELERGREKEPSNECIVVMEMKILK